MDIPFVGNRYIWRKKSAGYNNIFKRLDKVLVDNVWYNYFSDVNIKYLEFFISDYSFIILFIIIIFF